MYNAGDDTGGREVKGAITKSFPKRRVTEGAAVTRPAVASNIHNPEQVVGVHYGEEDQGEGALVIVIQGARVNWSLYHNMLPINRSDAVGEVPAPLKLLGHGAPVRPRGNRHLLLHQSSPDGTGYLPHYPTH